MLMNSRNRCFTHPGLLHVLGLISVHMLLVPRFFRKTTLILLVVRSLLFQIISSYAVLFPESKRSATFSFGFCMWRSRCLLFGERVI